MLFVMLHTMENRWKQPIFAENAKVYKDTIGLRSSSKVGLVVWDGAVKLPKLGWVKAKTSTLVKDYDIICVESLNVQG